MGIFDKLKHGLIKTKQSFTNQVDQVLASFGKVDEDLFEELEAALITSDLGVVTAAGIIEKLRARVKSDRAVEPGEVKDILRDIISDMLVKTETEFDFMDTPIVILVIGVNGVGKTTSIGKMASIYKSNGKSVVLAAADTFRAAAIEQLTVWAERAGVMLIKQSEGSDPAAVVYDACQSAKSKKLDVLICDTAGRLHNKKNLMDELHKITKVVTREMPGVRQETYLVLDATTGQNAVAQAKAFSEVANITGIILTKLDSSSKGGIIISISNELGIPVRFVGVGEELDDLQPFVTDDFVKALF